MSGTDQFFLVCFLVSFIYYAIKFQKRSGQRKEEIKNQEIKNNAIKAILNAHKEVLLLKSQQLRSQDAYGGVDNAAWEREKKYFFEKYIFPNVPFVGCSEIEQILISQEIDNFIGSLPKPKNLYSQKVEPGDGVGYEKYCAEKLKECGWGVRLTKASGDQGVDIIATKYSKKVVIQCKNHSKPVGNKAVQEVHSGMVYEKADAAVVVSRKGFTPSARRLANSTEVHLIDDSQIKQLDELLNAG